MEHIPGEVLSNYGKNVGKIMAETTAKLHNLDQEPLWKLLIKEGIQETLFTNLGTREEYIISNNLNWIKPALKWLNENRPTPDYAICHGARALYGFRRWCLGYG